MEAQSEQGNRQYRYDSLGNRVQSLGGGAETTHSYNARNQLIRTQEGEAVTDYSYDQRGNLTGVLENGKVQASYVFDATNRMVEAVTAEHGRAEYAYNGFLKRVKRLEEMPAASAAQTGRDPTRELRYILDLTRPYSDLLMTEGNDTQRYVWGNDLLMAEGERPYQYLQDHLGSPIRLVGSDREEALAYDEFGVPVVEAGGTLHNPFGFTGYQMDAVSGLHYAQARYYSAGNGRFVSEDPVKDQLNWYGYCGSSPISYIDPLGLYGVNPDDIQRGIWEELGKQAQKFAEDKWKGFQDSVNSAGESAWNAAKDVGSVISDVWNKGIYGEKTVVSLSDDTIGGTWGTYDKIKVSRTHANEQYTGSIIVKTTSLENNSIQSIGYTINVPSFDLGGGKSIGTPASIGFTWGSNGFKLSASQGLDLIFLKFKVDAAAGFNSSDWVSLDANASAAWIDNRVGIGAGVPLSPWESLKLKAFLETKNGDITEYLEKGSHLKMGTVYAVGVVAGLVAGILGGGLNPEIANQIFQHYWNSLSVAATGCPLT